MQKVQSAFIFTRLVLDGFQGKVPKSVQGMCQSYVLASFCGL